MKYYRVTYLSEDDFDIVKINEETPGLVLTDILVSSRDDERKFRAFSKTVWNSDRVKEVDPRLFPTFLSSSFVSEEFRNIIKEM